MILAPSTGLLLVNPRARLGKRDPGPAVAAIEKAAIKLVRPARHLEVWEFPDYIRSEGARSDFVIVGGGDGTLSTCAKAIADIDRPMGILPLGTANDLARTLDIPASLSLAGEIVARQKTKAVDLGLASGHPFFNVVTIGLAAGLASTLDSLTKQRWGRLGYAIGALRVAIGAKRFSASIETSVGIEKVKTYQIVVGNGRHYGGGVVVHSDATIHDGMLDLYSLELQTLWKLALMFPVFQRGEHGHWDDVRIDHADRFDISTRRPQPVNADGEVVTQTPVRIEILKKGFADIRRLSRHRRFRAPRLGLPTQVGPSGAAAWSSNHQLGAARSVVVVSASCGAKADDDQEAGLVITVGAPDAACPVSDALRLEDDAKTAATGPASGRLLFSAYLQGTAATSGPSGEVVVAPLVDGEQLRIGTSLLPSPGGHFCQ